MPKHLQRQLNLLERQLLALGARAEESLRNALHAFENRDAALAKAVIESDDDIDQMEVDLEEECLKVLALYQPVAADLRFIVSVLKINNDLERVGDFATNISRRVIELASLPPVQLRVDLSEISHLAFEILHKTLDAFVRLDIELAREVLAEDKKIDKRNRQIQREALRIMLEDPAAAEAYMLAVWVARALERVGDHATNIAEDVIYMLDGEIVRHATKQPAGGSRARNSVTA
jgi:phosphate transport system protein